MKLLISRSLTWWIQGLSSTCPVFKYFQGIIPILSNLGEKSSSTFKDAWEPCTECRHIIPLSILHKQLKDQTAQSNCTEISRSHVNHSLQDTTGSSSVHILPSHHSLWLYDYQSLRQGCLWHTTLDTGYSRFSWWLLHPENVVTWYCILKSTWYLHKLNKLTHTAATKSAK